MLQKQTRRNDQEWMEIIQECRSSGLSDQAWCHEHNIPVSTFYYHIRHLQKQACEVPAPAGKSPGPPQQVVPLQVIDRIDGRKDAVETDKPAIVIEAGTFHIGIHNHADRDTIQNALLALLPIC